MARSGLQIRLILAAGLLAGLTSAATAQSEEDRAVALEVRLVSFSEAAFERLGGILGVTEKVGKVRTLSEREMHLFMEAVQGDLRANVLQAPKLTVLDGAEATMTIGEEKPWTLSVRAAVASNGKSVRLRLKTNLGDLTDNEVKLRKNLSIADGNTVVMGGWKTPSAPKRPNQPQLLSKVPYVNRLFVNVSSPSESGRLLLFVTPRVLSNAE